MGKQTKTIEVFDFGSSKVKKAMELMREDGWYVIKVEHFKDEHTYFIYLEKD